MGGVYGSGGIVIGEEGFAVRTYRVCDGVDVFGESAGYTRLTKLSQ